MWKQLGETIETCIVQIIHYSVISGQYKYTVGRVQLQIDNLVEVKVSRLRNGPNIRF